MTAALTAPFFEIGPKNLLPLRELEPLAMAAGRAGAEAGVTVVLTVPTAFVAPLHRLDSGVLLFAQGMDLDPPGDSMARVLPEALAEVGAAGVMLNHVANPLSDERLAESVARSRDVGLLTIVCAETEPEALRIAALEPTAVLYEPPRLIGTAGSGEREWIAGLTDAVHRAHPAVLAMHAGGVSSPSVAERIMAAGADATGSTSGVLRAEDRLAAAGTFITATRAGWDAARRRPPASDLPLPSTPTIEGDRP